MVSPRRGVEAAMAEVWAVIVGRGGGQKSGQQIHRDGGYGGETRIMSAPSFPYTVRQRGQGGKGGFNLMVPLPGPNWG